METTTDQNTLERLLRAYKGLVEVSALINAITDFDELLSAILDVARRVMQAEASSLFLVDDAGNLRLVVARGPNGESSAAHVVVPRGRGIAGWVLEHGRGELVKDAYSDPRFYADVDRRTGFRTRSIICVPLRHDEKEIGVLQVLNPSEKPAFDQTDLEAFEAYGNLVSTAIERLRALQRQRDQERFDRELELAREIQTSFLPRRLPQLSGVSFAATYEPARNIGGDFYDVLPVGDDEIFFAIGDVSGKGIPAALLMAQAVSALRFVVKTGVAPGDALGRWNDALCGGTIRGMFITALLGKIVPSQNRLELVSAGHTSPIHCPRQADAHEIKMQGGLPLGIMPGNRYQPLTVDLGDGDRIVAYTDGLSESFSPRDELLDVSGIKRILAAPVSTPDETVATLIKGESTHRGDAERRDDLTILTLGFS